MSIINGALLFSLLFLGLGEHVLSGMEHGKVQKSSNVSHRRRGSYFRESVRSRWTRLLITVVWWRKLRPIRPCHVCTLWWGWSHRIAYPSLIVLDSCWAPKAPSFVFFCVVIETGPPLRPLHTNLDIGLQGF